VNDETVFIRCPARLDFVAVLRQVVVTICASETPESELYQVQLAVSELVTNIVTHAYGGAADGTIEFSAAHGDDRVTIDVYDTGQPFADVDVAGRVPDAPPDPDDLLEGGYGLFIIGQTMDVMTHTREADARNHWHLEKHFRRSAA